MYSRRQLLAALLLGTSLSASAQTLPPLLRIVVPFSAGASTDVAARALAQQLGARLGANVVVENRPGASGMIGSLGVVKGPRDGSQWLFTSVSTVSTAATTRNAPFDVTADLVPAAVLYEAPLLFVVPTNSPLRTPQDLVAAARARPDALTHGTAGIGTIAHLAAELFNDAAKVQIRHIPYRGASVAVPDLIGGRLDLMIAVNSTFGGQIKGGQLRAIGVTTDKPQAGFPGVRPMNSVAPGYAVTLWTALFAPAGTPAALVERMNKEVNEIGRSPEMAELMQADGAVPLALSTEQTARYVRESYATWKRVATNRHIVVE